MSGPDGFEFFSAGSPEEALQKMKEMHEKHKDLSDMTTQDFFHALENFMNELNDDNLKFFSMLASRVIEQEEPRFMLAQLTISAARILATRKNWCVVCMTNHDDEAAKVLTEGMQTVDPNAQGEVFSQELLDEMQATMLKYQMDCAEYGVVPSPVPGDKRVGCINCDYVYPSLQDRMLREPGVKGCPSCIEKAKWG